MDRAEDPQVHARELFRSDDRMPPSRGLVLAHNRRGKPFSVLDLKRWIRYNRLAFKVEKIDLLVYHAQPSALHELLSFAETLQTTLSLRTNCSLPPPSPSRLAESKFFDVFLCPDTLDSPEARKWLDACREAGIRTRLQLHTPFPSKADPEEWADRIAQAGVVRTNLSATDPFMRRHPARSAAQGRATVAFMQELASALEARDIEANLLHVPFCLLDEAHFVHAANARQIALDHAHYHPSSYELAVPLYERAPFLARQAILVLLARTSLHTQPVDNILLPWLIHRKYVHFWSRAVRRLTRHLNVFHAVPREANDSSVAPRSAPDGNTDLSPTNSDCATCRLRRICDQYPKTVRENLPGMEVSPSLGDLVVAPLHFCRDQRKYLDPIDLELQAARHIDEARVEKAREHMAERPPSRALASTEFGVERAHFDRMEGGLKWWSVSNVEQVSTVLDRLTPPFTISVDFGGGIADFIGFSLGRHCKLVCPMDGYRHTLVLHAEADGRYVLLRDDRAVNPSRFEGQHYVPRRLGGVLEPRISIWNIDESISTHSVRIWSGEGATRKDSSRIRFSIIIVSTRFSRRLDAVLRSIAHQRDVDLAEIEVVVAYVPGLDATDDLLDSVSLAYPALHVIRAPFTEADAHAKGFMINEAGKMTSGEWTMLLDSDTLLPPTLFSAIDAAPDSASFIAPDGRKLLDPKTTARILMGELQPWACWEELMTGPGEFRHRETDGIPVGFCQIFKSKYLQQFPYTEVNHFENADMWFGEQLREHLGPEHRLSGVPVLHLDHGGSQWYGTRTHL